MHKYESPQINGVGAAIVGVRGYAGLELARLLLAHPQARLVRGFATDGGFALSEYLPEAAALPVDPVSALDPGALAREASVVFLATPAEAAIELAPRLLAAGLDVIDLSGAFRLEAGAYPRWYGFVHAATPLLERAVYGLSPWCGPAAPISGARLIANPGCYATAVLMGLIPILKEGLVEASSLVVDAKSGTTGAGRKPKEGLLYSEVEGECLPYKIGGHQHLPEIQKYLGRYSGQPSPELMFTTHLLPVRRGIIAGTYARKPVSLAGLNTEEWADRIAQAYDAAYADYPLASVAALPAEDPAREKQLLSLRKAVGTARTEIRFRAVGSQLYVFVMIDNLMKGAASQAVENLNRLQDWPVATGLSGWKGIL